LHVMRGLDPRIHLVRMMDRRVKPGNDGPQNKKYLCAIGSASAGAQVSNSPSALTS
jgi:hypothetical protein